jgi:curli biogenesis system outer membrane secretion channel CsgG
MKSATLKISALAASAIILGACSATTPTNKNMDILDGPPVTSIVTPYDEALTCAREQLGQYDSKYKLAVGTIQDATGKFSTDNGGNGYYITQGAGKILQSAFYTAQPDDVLNRTDVSVMQTEIQLGRQLQWQGTDLHATGAVTTLDFVPGGGAEVSVAGVSAKAKQFRLVVGMDISLTNTMNSAVEANTSIHKQIVALDYGVGMGRFFGTTLVTMSIGEQRREAIGFATRNMLKLAAFNLLEQVYQPMPDCRKLIENVEGVQDASEMEANLSSQLRSKQVAEGEEKSRAERRFAGNDR